MTQDLLLRLRTMLGFGRGLVQDDTGPVQSVQMEMSALETLDDLPRVAEYGYTSSPPAGFDAVVVFPGGQRAVGVVIGTNHQASRKKGLKPGEVAIYDDLGQSVYLTRTGIVVNGAGLPIQVTNTPTITLDTPQVTATGNSTTDGNATVDGNSTVVGGSTVGGNASVGGNMTVAGTLTVGGVLVSGGADAIEGQVFS